MCPPLHFGQNGIYVGTMQMMLEIGDKDEKSMCRNSLIDKYLPADYMDSHSREVVGRRSMTPNEFCDMAFNQLPKWIDWLMKLRNVIVKPLGLDTGGKFTDMICDESVDEVVFGMPDKHLTFYVSMWCGEYIDNKQNLMITTVVRYNNTLGKVYFFVIRPFHSMIVSSILRKIDKVRQRQTI